MWHSARQMQVQRALAPSHLHYLQYLQVCGRPPRQLVMNARGDLHRPLKYYTSQLKAGSLFLIENKISQSGPRNSNRDVARKHLPGLLKP